MVWEHRLEGFTAEEVKDLRDTFGDLWFQLATLMGHADPATTRDIYLEPFCALQVDYLMSLLDEEEKRASTLAACVAAQRSDVDSRRGSRRRA